MLNMGSRKAASILRMTDLNGWRYIEYSTRGECASRHDPPSIANIEEIIIVSQTQLVKLNLFVRLEMTTVDGRLADPFLQPLAEAACWAAELSGATSLVPP